MHGIQHGLELFIGHSHFSEILPAKNNIMMISVISSALLVSTLGVTNDATSLTISLCLFFFLSARFTALLGTIFTTLSSSVLELGHRQGIAFFLMGIATLISLPSQSSLVGKPHHCVWWK